MSLLVEKSVKYLVIKSGQNMVMKHLLAGDQTQIFNQFELSSEEVVFINKDFLIQKTTQNSLKIIDLNNMEEQTEIKYNIFTIQEPKEGGNLLVPLIAIETNQIIQIFQLMKENNKILLKPFVGEIIIAQDNQTNLAFSDNSYFFAYSNKQSINIYQIKSQQIVKLSTINIDFEVKKIELSNFQNICILSQDRLIFYNNFQVIETIDNFHKHTDLEDQDVKTNTLFTSLKLNHNDKLLALQFQDHIYFQTLSEIDSNNAINKASKGQKLYSNMFSTSIDNKTFAILDQRIRTIKYYDFDWKNIFQPLYILEIENEQNLLNIQFINDPNSILVIYPDNIQIWNHKSQKKEKSIEGSYNFKTQVSINTDVAVIVYSKILINKNIKSRTTYQQQFLAKYPHFTSDGQYIVFEKNNVEIMFQSLQDPKLTYTFKICNKENFLTLLPQSNLLITFDNRRFYFNFWDASILDNINLLHKIPILDNRENCKLYKQLLISKNNKNVYCIYNLKELINNSYDNILDTKCSLLMMCPNETKYCKVDENKISIWNLKERVRLEDFIGHFEAISAVNFTQDEKYMVSVDRGGLIIVWNMLNHQNIKIDLNKKAELVSCKFMNIQDSLGITCMIQNEIVIFDLKNFESYEIYHRIPTNQQYEIIDQNVFSKGNKLAISYLIEKKRLCIRIFKVDTKEIIENITISYFQIFICSINSEEYFIKDKKEQYISVITQETNHFWMYNWSLQFLEIYNFNSSSGALPIYRIFLPLNSQDICRYGSLKRVRVGNKYLTYYYEDQFRIIDLELYKQQVYFCVFDNEIDFKGQLSEDTLILFQSDNQSQSYNLINYKSDQQQIQTLFNTDCNQFILAFSNNGQYCAQGWNLGHIRIFKVQNNKKWSKWGDWNSKQKKIDCLIFIQNDEILISSQYNELSFWNMKQETIQKGTLIQEIKIDFKIEEIVDSHNGYIALSLEGGIIQIITIDQSKCNIENENYKKQYFGCYRSFPQLYNIQTQNCIIQNSIIKNQDNQSILHLFSNQEIKEFESGFNNEETDE
ncbi:unnamed protein product [Paramecium sonneborni]|uniref:WD40-repeat-containing domain n=1 Tax=Paramecium sonneborni TaxID=65129 RepID=A0A8S1R5C0_9CILI|nr:unnamed protein product [Paramecium sonneborni]